MAGVDFSQPILGAGASAKTDFAAAQARAGLNFIGEARFKRGVKADIGIEAFANASGEISKFIQAKIEGTAFARAKAGTQLQMPLNLFDEFGFSVRAEAIAEAGAGVEVALGLSIGDFILLAQRDNNLIGLPLEILFLFLEEVTIGGSFEVNVSASAKAHASVSVAGTIIEKAGDKAGFYYTVDAGVGLAAGVGMGLKAGAEFKDFRRFFGRAVDKSVDGTIQEILKLLPSDLKLSLDQSPLNPQFEAFAPIAKIALRIAYEVGFKIAENNPGHSKNDTAILCDEAVKIFLEESQRFIFNKLLESGISSLGKLLELEASNLTAGHWDAAIQERTALAGQLLTMPTEPFKTSEENLIYWETLIEKAIALVITIGDPNAELTKLISIIYCTSELLMEAVRAKVNSASAYATAIGAGTVNSDTEPFKGTLSKQPDQKIVNAISNVISGNGSLKYADLLQFLFDDAIVNNALATFPELNQFVKIFKNDFGKAENEILKLLLQNASSFNLTNPNAVQVDSHTLLKLIVQSIDKFITESFKTDILPQILHNLSDPNLKLYLEEVLLGSVVYMKDVGLTTILNWENESFDNDDFTEGLAGVIMLLLGRTVVIIADTFVKATQEQIQNSCNDVAEQIRNYGDNPNANHNGIQNIIPHLDPDFISLTADCIEIGGVVLGPLSDGTRRRVRNLLYQVFELIPPGKEQDFLTSLGDDFFIPNVDQLQQLTNELADISKDRFIQFVEQFILKIGEYILEKLKELILALIDLVVHWERHLAKALINVADFLRNLEVTMRLLNQQIINSFSIATDSLHNLFQTLSSSSLKNRIKNDIKRNFVNKALDQLNDNGIYQGLPPEWRREIRNLADDVIDAVIDNPFTEPIFDAIAAIANQLDELLPNVRELDPDENLPEQLMLLILDKIEDNIRNHYGGRKPHISPIFRLRVWWPDLSGGHYDYIDIPLGRIEINLTPFINIVRNAIKELDFYHTALNDACFKLGLALANELDLAAKQLLNEEKTAEKARLDKINSEYNNDPKEIAILSPLSLSHFTKAIDVKIHLGGVSMSYLGLGKHEQQKAFIFINGELIPPKSLIIDDSGLSAGTNNAHLVDFDYANLNSFDKVTGNLVNAFNIETGIIKTSKASIMTDSALNYPTQETQSKIVNSGTRYPFSNSKLKELPESKSFYKAQSKNQASGDLFFERTCKTIEKNEGELKGKLFVHNYELKNNMSGRKISASKIDSLLHDRIPGILIQFKVNLDEDFIVEGVNVLTVLVIERGGHRHQQNVSFTVSHESIVKKPTPGMISVFNPKTNKTETAVMTLNNVINHFNSNDKQNESSMEDFLFSVEKVKSKENEFKVPKIISTEPYTELRMKKKETIVVLKKDKRGMDRNIGKPIYLEYSSVSERTDKIIKKLVDTKLIDEKLVVNKKYNKLLADKNMRLKTEIVIYEKSLSVIGNDNKEIKGIKQLSTFIKKETLEVLNEKGKLSKTIRIEYASDAEREGELNKLKIRSKQIRSKTIEIEEKTIIVDEHGKHLQSYYKKNKPVELNVSEIRTYKPNSNQKIKFEKELQSDLGLTVKNETNANPPNSKPKKKSEEKANFISSELLTKRIGGALDYLKKQDQIIFK